MRKGREEEGRDKYQEEGAGEVTGVGGGRRKTGKERGGERKEKEG